MYEEFDAEPPERGAIDGELFVRLAEVADLDAMAVISAERDGQPVEARRESRCTRRMASSR